MNAQAEPGHEEQNVSELIDGPGRRLRAARQARGLEVQQIAAELHLSPPLIEALERDDYDVLPGSVFVVGYLRKYARVVGLDAEPLMDAYRAACPGAELVERRILSPRVGQQVGSGNLWVRLASLAIVAVIAALAFVWWHGQNRSGDAALPEEESVASDAVAEQVQARGAEPAVAISNEEILADPVPDEPVQANLVDEPLEAREPPEPQVEPTTSGAAIAAEPPSPVLEGESRTDQAATEPDAQPAGADQEDPAGEQGPPETVIEFSGPCWVDIRDSERKFKLFGEMRKGDRHVLEGSPPYSVILGNAAAVKITVAGNPFALDDIARGNVARFTLDPSRQP